MRRENNLQSLSRGRSDTRSRKIQKVYRINRPQAKAINQTSSSYAYVVLEYSSYLSCYLGGGDGGPIGSLKYIRLIRQCRNSPNRPAREGTDAGIGAIAICGCGAYAGLASFPLVNVTLRYNVVAITHVSTVPKQEGLAEAVLLLPVEE